jgi:hypothetical protein
MSGNFIDPVNGNQSFGSVNQMAAGINNLVVHNQIKSNSVDGKLPQFTLVGYTPTNFSTADASGGSAVVWALNTLPNKPGNEENALLIPQGVVAIQAVLEAVNPIVGTLNGTLNLGLSSTRGTGGTDPSSANDLLSGTNYSTSNLDVAGTRVGVFAPTGTTVLGTAGENGSTADQYINITLNTTSSPVLTSGSLKAMVTFVKLDY